MQKLAPAKINILLKIISTRPDGYHDIFSIFQTISLYDIIDVQKLKKDEIIIECNLQKLANKNNLCYKVADLVKKRYKIKYGVRIKIYKTIPLGSGLGGASSDAFTTLQLLQKIWDLKLSKNEIIKICSLIGKDVPYFFYKGCCIVESAGEKIRKIIPFWKTKPLWILLIYPNKILLTKDVYKKFDEKNFLEKKEVTLQTKFYIPNNKNQLKNIVYNDLEPAAMLLFPELKKIKFLLKSCGAEIVSMSGSGSTMFALFDNKKDAENVYTHFIKKYKKCKVYLTKSIF